MEKELYDFFDRRIAACGEERKRLLAEDCRDEANFEKIRENVYDIFRTVLSASRKKYGDNTEEMREFFQERLEQIPAGWTASYERARKHEDIETMHIESIKLEVVKDIRENIFHSGKEDK